MPARRPRLPHAALPIAFAAAIATAAVAASASEATTGEATAGVRNLWAPLAGASAPNRSRGENSVQPTLAEIQALPGAGVRLAIAEEPSGAGTADQPPAESAYAEIKGARAKELERLVLHDCGSCHGLTLAGGLGSPLGPDALETAGLDADRIVETILDGVPGTAMPAWRPLLAETEARWIAEYLLRGGVEK